MTTTRRELLVSAAGLGALAGLHTLACASQDAAPAPKQLPFRISLAQWSHHKALFAGHIDHRDFAKFAKEDYGIDAVEFVNTFFKDKADDPRYLADVKSRADDLGVRILLIMCDGEGDLGHADAKERAKAVENHRKWLHAAQQLGCHSIRVNAAGSGSREEHAAQAVEGLRALAEIAAPLELDVIVENHGGLSSDGAWLSGVLRKAAHPRLGSLPDFGNFNLGGGQNYDRYRGVEELMPFARAVSAKSHDFDAQGNETATDYRRMLRIVHAAGYRGHVGIEYEGTRLGEPEGIRATKALLEKVRSEIA